MSIYIFSHSPRTDLLIFKFIFKTKMIGQVIINRGSSVVLRRTLLTAQSRCMLQIPRLSSLTSQSQVSNIDFSRKNHYSSDSQEQCQGWEVQKKASYVQQVRLTTCWLWCFSFGDLHFGVCRCGESSANRIRLRGFLHLSEIRPIMSTKTRLKVWSLSTTILLSSNFMERKCF